MFLGLAGIDIPVSKARCNQSSPTSKANTLGLSKKDIHRAAGWGGNNTFRIFDNLLILQNFGDEIVSDFSKDKN